MKRTVESSAQYTYSKRQVVEVKSFSMSGKWIAKQSHLNKGTSFTLEERDRLGVRGIVMLDIKESFNNILSRLISLRRAHFA
jgi:hypothetical protein